MNTTDKDNLLQQAVCCSGTKGKQVADMFLLGHKCAEKEFKRLALLNFSIQALDCYNAPLEETTYTVIETTEVLAEFTFSIPCSRWDAVLASGTSINVVVNGVGTGFPGDDATTFETAFTNILNAQSFALEDTGCGDDPSAINTITVVANCDTTSISVTYSSGDVTITYTGEQTVLGNCGGQTLESTTETTEYDNCFTEDEADNIADIITKICDICDCENN